MKLRDKDKYILNVFESFCFFKILSDECFAKKHYLCIVIFFFKQLIL